MAHIFFNRQYKIKEVLRISLAEGQSEYRGQYKDQYYRIKG